jgi:hypothetical protein
MTLWLLLQGIAFTTAMFSGWYAGKPAGIVGILIGLFIGAFVGFGGVWSMFGVDLRFYKWITLKKLSLKVELLAALFFAAAGLTWCFVIGAAVQIITKFLIHLISA